MHHRQHGLAMLAILGALAPIRTGADPEKAVWRCVDGRPTR